MNHHNQSKELTIWFLSTTLPKVDKADTSSVEGPTAQALVAWSESKASNDNPTNNDSNLLNSIVVLSGIACWMSSLL
jgi:hypothetical protein